MKLLPLLFLLCATALPAEELPRAKAIDEAAVRALLGKKSIITGKVTEAFDSPKGMTFLNLDGGRFTLVVFKDTYEKFEGGSPAKLYKDKTIEVTGEIIEYRNKGTAKEDPGKLEIKVNSPDQVKVLPPAASDAAPKPADAPMKDKKAPAPADPKTPAKPDAATDPNAAPKTDKVDPKKYFK